VQGLLRATKDDCREGTCLLPTGAVDGLSYPRGLLRERLRLRRGTLDSFSPLPVCDTCLPPSGRRPTTAQPFAVARALIQAWSAGSRCREAKWWSSTPGSTAERASAARTTSLEKNYGPNMEYA